MPESCEDDAETPPVEEPGSEDIFQEDFTVSYLKEIERQESG